MKQSSERGKKQLQSFLPGSTPRFRPLRVTDEPVHICSFPRPNAGSPLNVRLFIGADIPTYHFLRPQCETDTRVTTPVSWVACFPFLSEVIVAILSLFMPYAAV